MLPVPVPEAELSSPDTMLPEMNPLDWLRSPIDDVAAARARSRVVIAGHDDCRR